MFKDSLCVKLYVKCMMYISSMHDALMHDVH